MFELIPFVPVAAGVAAGIVGGVGGVILCRTIQHRRQSRITDSLRDSEGRWRRVVEITPNAVFVHVDGRIVFANSAMAELMGASAPDQLVGMDAMDVLHPDQRRLIRDQRGRMISDRKAINYQTMRYRTLDGRDLWIDAGAAILPWDGQDGFMVVARDITARRKNEQALRESEARYRAVVEDQEELIIRALPDGTVTFVNDAFCRYFARPYDELVGIKFNPVILEEEHQAVQAALAGLSPENPIVTVEHSVIRPDGQLRWHRWVNRLLCVDGVAVERQSVGRDVTEYRDAEQALRNSEARYRAVVEDQTELIARYIPDGTLTFVNDAYCRFFAIDRKAILGRPFKPRVPAGDHLEVDKMVARLVAGATSELRERRVIRADGETLWIQWTNRAVRDSEGNLIEIQAVGREVTDQKRAAEALQDSEIRLREIIDLAPVQIFVRDTEGKFLLVNRAVADLYGTTVEALTGGSQRDFHPDPGEMERFLESDRAVLASGERMIIPDQTFEDFDGRTRHIETIKIPFTADGGASPAILGVSLDITEKREAAAQLHQAQKMEAVGQLTGGVAHDFNNLLAVVLGNLQLLERDVAPNEDLSALAGAAIDATRRGAGLTRQLLAFSRQQPLEPAVLDLNQLIGESSMLLTRSLGEPYTVESELDGNLWYTMADSSQVESAILNLVINSSQAMQNGGRIIIRTRNVELDAREVAGLADVDPGDYIALSVADQGCGMPPEVADRAFDPFFTTKSASGGSGLGLSMVYGFARQSKGCVRIESTEGEGTEVTLYLPRTNEIAPAPSALDAAVDIGGWSDAIVMVVEDDPDVREVAVKLLDRLGYRVRVAASGPDALREYDRDPDIDILFTDMVLPDGMSGSDLAIQLRNRCGDLPILFTSGNTEVDPENDSRLSGRYSFLRKPYLAEDLASKLRELSLSR